MTTNVLISTLASNARQAITTRYAGPTNTRGSRIIATTASGLRRTVRYDYALNSSENHCAAALALAESLGWLNRATPAFGATKDGYVLVLTCDAL